MLAKSVHLSRLFCHGIERVVTSANLNVQLNQQILDKIDRYSQVNNLITVVDLNHPAILSDINRHIEALIGALVFMTKCC